jgi:hypothetical protein
MSAWEIFWRYGWAFALALQLLGLWVSWSLSKGFVTHTFFASFSQGVDERFKAMEQRQIEVESMHKQLVSALAALPTAKDLHRIEVSLTGIDGAVKASQAEVCGLYHAVNRIERVVDMFTESHLGGGK